MEKIESGFTYEYPMLRLYRDDLASVGELLEANYAKVNYETDEYHSESMAEILSVVSTQPLRRLRIHCYKDNVYAHSFFIVLDSGQAYSHVGSVSDTFSIGIAASLDRILAQKESRWRLFEKWWMFLLLWCLLASLSNVVLYSLPVSDTMRTALALPTGLIVMFPIVICYVGVHFLKIRNRHVLMYLTNHSDMQGFFARHKEKIMIHAVNTLISLLIGGTVGFLISRIIGR